LTFETFIQYNLPVYPGAQEKDRMKNSRTNWTFIRWTLLTMVGLAAGIIAAVLLDRPIEAVVGMMLVTPILTLGAGAILGASQWIQLRSMIDHTKLWVLATCIGLGVGLALGVVTVEYFGRILAGRRPNLFHLSVPWRTVSFAALGLITGCSVGTAQWLIVLRRRGPSPKWIAISAASLAIAFSLSSLIVDGIVGRGIASAPGAITFVLLAGAIFGAGTARPLLRTA
jgi:hypothetical protein